MTEVATVTTEDSPLWIKQRSSVLSTDNNKTPKGVDKELARLKNIGAVSSVWTNKFVQEDNSGGRRPSYSSKSPSPTNENFNTRIRSLSGNKKLADDISLLNQSRLSMDSQHRKQQSSISSRLSKTSISSLDLTENTSRTSLMSDCDMYVSPTSFDSIKSQYDECHALLTKANQEVEFYKQQLAQEVQKKTEIERSSQEEAAALWFQCETFKTQSAQIESKLKKANADIESYKSRLEENQHHATEDISRVRQLAELVLKQEALLKEYEMNLGSDTDDFGDLRKELMSLEKQKEVMENTIDSLRADLEMSHGQMRLMLVVSTEIQNEFENFKEAKENEMKQLLSEKDNEHQEELSTLHQQYSNQPQNVSNKYYEDQIEQLKQALVAKDKVIADIQNQLRTQRMSMDAQMMELTETILEKDTLLMEFMSSRNSSKEVVAPNQQQNQQSQVHPLQNAQQQQQQQQQPIELSRLLTTSVAPADVTNMFYHPEEEEDENAHTPRIQMAKVREFMYSESDSDIDEDDHSEVLVLSYSSDEDEMQQQDYYHHLSDLGHNEQPQHFDPTSPTSSIVSFESASSSEEKIAEIKHFSYSSAQSQSTRPISLNSATESISGNQELDINTSVRLSNIKDAANWPMPPPTPPPSEPLPPVPGQGSQSTGMAPPPPRRGRSRTMVREEIPNLTDLPGANPNAVGAPVPPPRKAHLKLEKHRTSWMDDPEENAWQN